MYTRTATRGAVLTLAVAAALTGCTITDAQPELSRMQGCAELSTYMQDMALDEARWRWATNIQPVVGFQESSIAFAADAGGGAARAATFSETNVQEVGVDEADLVKTDGAYLYSIAAGNTLVISDAWPVEEAAELSQTRIDGNAVGLYLLDDDRIVVLSNTFAWDGEDSGPRSGVDGEREEPVRTLVTIVDITDRADPKVVRETYTSGELEDSRRIGDRLFVVTYVDVEAAAIGQRVRNYRDAKRAIEVAPVEAWMPRRVDNLLRADGTWDTTDESSCGCTDIYASPAEGGTFVTSVLSLDLSDPLGAFEGEAVVGRADTIYASPTSLYVAYTETAEGPFASLDGALDTVLHRFRIGEDEAKPAYHASAKLVGMLPDQFALSEQNGVLRVATTDTQVWSSNVYTLEAGEGELDRLDKLTGIAPGERIFSSRFVGDIGYLVTYVVEGNGVSIPNIPFGDPLFTIDMSDPEALELEGELVLDGWSDYIHPLGEDHLVTVGMDSDDENDWQLSVSLFDVSDLANPVLQDRVLPGSRSSEAQLEHHAFTWYPERNLLAIPSQDLQWNSNLDVIRVTPEDGLELVGKMTQDPAMNADQCQPIRRSVFLEDYVYTVSTRGLTGASIEDLDTVAASVPYAGMQDQCDPSFWW